MAIGDKAAAAGLDVFPSTQDRRLGYQNDNQRGDDIAKVMGRVDKLEGQVKVAAGFSNDQTSAGGRIVVTHGMGTTPRSVILQTADNGVIPRAQKEVVTDRSSKTFTVTVYRLDQDDQPVLANRGAAFFWAAFA